MKRLLVLISSLALLVSLLTGCSKDDNLQKENHKPLLISYESGNYVLDAENSKIRFRIVSGNGGYTATGSILDENNIEFESLIEVTFKKDEFGEYCEMRLIKPDWSDTWRADICIADKSGQKENISLSATNPINWI